jgi:hypothetical protein
MPTCIDCHWLPADERARIGLPQDQPWYNRDGTEAATKIYLGTTVGGAAGVGLLAAPISPETKLRILLEIINIWKTGEPAGPMPGDVPHIDPPDIRPVPTGPLVPGPGK